MESDQFMPEYWPANRIIGKLEKALVKAENILGLIQSEQIANLAAAKVTGLLTSAQIKEIEAAKVAGQLTNAQIKEIEAAKITGQLTNAQIKEIEAAKITGLITETQIGPEAIATPLLKAGAVTAAKVAAEAITAEKIAALTITAAKLAANSVTSEKINALAVTAGKIAAEAITTEKLAANSVTAAKIVAGSITAEKLSVVSLSAISANLGTVTAGTIKGVKIEALESFILEDGSGTEPELSHSIQWTREGTAREEIFGTDYGSVNTSYLLLWANRKQAAKKGNVQLISYGKGSKKTSGLEVSASESLGEVAVSAFESLATIIDSSGQSSFLQLSGGAPAKKKINFGFAEVEWAGGVPESKAKVVNHSLGVQPAVVFAFFVGFQGEIAIAEATNVGEKTLEVRARFGAFKPVAGSKGTVCWLVLG